MSEKLFNIKITLFGIFRSRKKFSRGDKLNQMHEKRHGSENFVSKARSYA